MSDDGPRQDALFDLGPTFTETAIERKKRLNREHQLTWRRKHRQFCVPIIEAPIGATYTTCTGT